MTPEKDRDNYYEAMVTMAPEREPGGGERKTHLSNNIGLQIRNDGELSGLVLDFYLFRNKETSVLCG